MPLVALLMFMCIVSILCVIMRAPLLVQYLVRMVSASTIPPVHHMQCGVPMAPYEGESLVHHMQCGAPMAPCEGECLPVLPRPSL